VKVLRDGGVETYESCQGGTGHSYVEPAVRFFGGHQAGYQAVGVAMTFGLPIRDLRRFWTCRDGELVGPYWELTFWRDRLVTLQREAERNGLIA
jgi:hypothetical protein